MPPGAAGLTPERQAEIQAHWDQGGPRFVTKIHEQALWNVHVAGHDMTMTHQEVAHVTGGYALYDADTGEPVGVAYESAGMETPPTGWRFG